MKNKQLKSSITALQRDTKDSSLRSYEERKAQLLAEIKPRMLSINASELTPKEAHDCIQVTVAKSDKELLAHLYGAILDVCASVDANKGLDEDSASETLEMLLRDFYYMKYSEFLLVFRMMKEGRFGNFYERLKQAEFTRCFQEYDTGESRSEMWENLHRSNKIDTLPDMKTTEEKVEFYKKWLKSYADKIDARKELDEKDREYRRIRDEYNNKNK